MDWAKAKTYLILAFAITNIVLLSNILLDYRQGGSNLYFSDESLKNFTELLRQQGISLNTDLPRETPKMGTLKVEYIRVEEEKLENLFTDYGMGLQVMDRKKITINGSHNMDNISKDEAIKSSKAFIKNNGLDDWEYEVKYIREYDDSIKIHYNSIYDKMFLEESFISFIYDIYGSFTMDMIRLDVIEKSRNKIEVMTSVEAIMRALSQLEPGDEIVEIRLGYYLSQDQNVPITQTRSATAFPAWRIGTADGRYYYIQALEF